MDSCAGGSPGQGQDSSPGPDCIRVPLGRFTPVLSVLRPNQLLKKTEATNPQGRATGPRGAPEALSAGKENGPASGFEDFVRERFEVAEGLVDDREATRHFVFLEYGIVE